MIFNQIIIILMSPLLILLLTCLVSQACGCEIDEFPSSPGVCEACSDYVHSCYTCTGANQCTQCIDQHFVVNSSCQSCDISNCVHCDNTSLCTECAPDYILIHNSVKIFCGACDDTNCYCNNSICTSCFDSYYMISGTSTVLGTTRTYYSCAQCDPICFTCSNIDTCDSCNSNFYLNETSLCEQCPAECYCDNSTYCTSCITDYFRNSSSGECQVCPNTCQCADSAYCSSCLFGRVKNENGGCDDICGDLLAFQLPCDLELGTELDGCTDECQIQDNFTCKVQDSTKESICSYNGTISIQILTIQKQTFANSITVQFQLQPHLPVLKSVDPNLYLSFKEDFTDPSFSFDASTFTYTGRFNYDKDIEGESFTILFNVSESVDERFWATNDTGQQFKIKTHQYLPAYYYSPAQYSFSQFLSIFTIVLPVLALIIYIIGMFSPGKLAGLEIIFVIQYAFVCLLWYDSFFYLPMYFMKNLTYSCGYNYPFFDVESSKQPPKAYQLGLSARCFLSNLNIMMVMYLVTLIPLLIYKIKQLKEKDEDLKYHLEERVEIFCDLTMYTCFFNLVYSLVCAVIFLQYGEFTDIASDVVGALSLFFTFSSLLGFWLFPGSSRRFRFSFRKEKLPLAHYYFHLLCIISSVLLLTLLPNYPWCSIIPQILMVIYTLVMKPYPLISENLRSAYNYLTMTIITSMRIYYWMTSEQQHRQIGGYAFIGVVIVMLFLGIVWAYVSVIKDIVFQKCIKKMIEKNLAYDLFEDEQTRKKLEKSIINSELFKAKNILNSFSPADLRQKYVNIDESSSENSKLPQNIETPKEIKTEDELKIWLKKQRLPGSSKAIEMLMNQNQFLRYYEKVWKKKQEFNVKLNENEKKMYDQI